MSVFENQIKVYGYIFCNHCGNAAPRISCLKIFKEKTVCGYCYEKMCVAECYNCHTLFDIRDYQVSSDPAECNDCYIKRTVLKG